MTTKTRSFRPSPAMFVACIALFVALAGSAVAAGIAKNSVGSNQIVDGGVRNVDVHNGAIGATKISPGAVTAPAIAPDAVTGPAIADGSVGGGDIADNSIASSKVIDEGLSGTDLAAGTVTAKQIGTIGVRTNTATVENGKVVGVAELCNSNEKVVGGGGAPSDLGVKMISSRPQSNGWAYQAKNESGATATVTVYAMCLAG
jgi:hypothetical protein